MRCEADTTLDEFAERALPHLQRDPVRNSVSCTIIETRRAGVVPLEPDALWLRVLDERDNLVLVALRTPPFPLLIAEPTAEATAPTAVDSLVDHLLTAQPDLPGVSGPVPVVQRFVDRWSTATGGTPTRSRSSRLFRLDGLTPPRGVPGRLRSPDAPDRDVLITWVATFWSEVGEQVLDAPAAVDRWLARHGALWVWDVEGEPVSMLGIAPVSAGVARINLVYTPPGRRGNGYASAAVAAASRWVLDNGAEQCMLYTDLANPTSNKIYQAIGYRPVGDAAVWQLR